MKINLFKWIKAKGFFARILPRYNDFTYSQANAELQFRFLNASNKITKILLDFFKISKELLMLFKYIKSQGNTQNAQSLITYCQISKKIC